MNIYILLTSVGSDAGPFNIFSDVGGYLSAFATNVSSATLAEGYPAIVPDGTTIVRLRSIGECTNYLDVPVTGGPVITTTTTTTNQYLNYWYYGKYNSPGGIVPIPTEVDINVLSGSAVTVLPPLGIFTIPFNSVNDDFLWLAIPTSVGTKSTWFVNSLNQGLIGGPVNNFGNLFSDPVIVTYNSVPMYLYISTARTDVVQIIIG